MDQLSLADAAVAGLGENVTLAKADMHEALDLYAPWPSTLPSSASRPLPALSGENQWPSRPDAFRGTVEAWIERMKKLGAALMQATADGLGMDQNEADGLLKLTENSFW